MSGTRIEAKSYLMSERDMGIGRNYVICAIHLHHLPKFSVHAAFPSVGHLSAPSRVRVS